MKVLLSAFRCDPEGVSEAYLGFQWVEQIARFSKVHLVTDKVNEEAVKGRFKHSVSASYIVSKDYLCRFPRISKAIKLNYFNFNKKLDEFLRSKSGHYDLVHHLTPIAVRYPSILSKRKDRFLLGPVGGGISNPKGFEKIFNREPIYFKLKKIDKIRFQLDKQLKETYEQAQKILIIGEYVKQIIPSRYHEKCEIMCETGISSEEYRPLMEPISNEVPQLLFVGRLVPYKALELILFALKELLTSQKVQLTVIGSGPNREYYQRLVKELGIDGHVCFKGNLKKSEIIQYYQRSDLFVFPSLKETSGNVILEAMSCGLPVVVSDRGGPGEIVKKEFGVKIKVENYAQYIYDLVEVIGSLIKNKGRMVQMGHAAREEILRKYDWDVKGEMMRRVYEEVING